MRLFDFGLQLSEDLITHPILLALKLGIIPCSGIKLVPPPTSQVFDGHIQAHVHSKNGSRFRYVDNKRKSCGGKSKCFAKNATCNNPLCLKSMKSVLRNFIHVAF